MTGCNYSQKRILEVSDRPWLSSKKLNFFVNFFHSLQNISQRQKAKNISSKVKFSTCLNVVEFTIGKTFKILFSSISKQGCGEKSGEIWS